MIPLILFRKLIRRPFVLWEMADHVWMTTATTKMTTDLGLRYAFFVGELRQDRRKDGVQMVKWEINEIVSPTKSDTYGPISISPKKIYTWVLCSQSEIVYATCDKYCNYTSLLIN